jgi:hypothetical protein
MIDLKKFSSLTAFKCGSNCEMFAKTVSNIEEFVANSEAEWLLAIAEEIADEVGEVAYNEVRRQIVLTLVDCALIDSDRYTDEQLDLLWIAEEWAKNNAHDDDFQSALVSAYRDWDWCDVRDFHLKTKTLPRYEATKIIWFVFKNENHKSLVTIMGNFKLRHNGKSAELEFKKECAEICREFLGEIIINHYNKII